MFNKDDSDVDQFYAYMAFVISHAALIVSVLNYLRPSGGKYCTHSAIEARDEQYLNTLKDK